ncbi:MAG: hypothetical protein H6719_30535 [Sandaracinaceae bacterium]|nr:hypothetical protein [Sandaracinaceae bacterium]
MSRITALLLVSTLLGCTAGRTSTGDVDDPIAVDFRFAERATADNDPFFSGTATPTEVRLAAGQTALFEGTADARDGNETWADSDGYALEVTEPTWLQADLRHEGRGGTWAVAIHRSSDRALLAWWGMSSTSAALTHPIEVPAGSYFVHVASEAPGPSSPIPYTVTLRTGDLGTCASDAAADHLEREPVLGANDAIQVRWASFPQVELGRGSAEPTGLEIARDAARVLEGVSGTPPNTADSYLDRDAFEITTGPGVTELRVRLEHASADVNLDVMLLSADGRELLGTGVEIGDSPELAAVPVAPSTSYVLWIGARDERSIGGDTALPLAYRAVLCGRGAP